ncbi:MAG: hypothetical protein IT539_10735 [Bradyrhizobiaceae bacterium]|nr:hypothetical protein [Bradyrhizobiaceae bacterium]
MRFLLGMIFGAFLLFAGAYLHDDHSSDPALQQRNMVNWSVVSETWTAAKTRLQKEWTQLSSTKL